MKYIITFTDGKIGIITSIVNVQQSTVLKMAPIEYSLGIYYKNVLKV